MLEKERDWLTTTGFMDLGRLARCHPIAINPTTAAPAGTQTDRRRGTHRDTRGKTQSRQAALDGREYSRFLLERAAKERFGSCSLADVLFQSVLGDSSPACE